MFLRGRIKQLNRRLSFGIEPPGKRFSIFRCHVPGAIVCFDRPIRIQDVQQYFGAITRRDAGQIRADVFALPIESVANRAIHGEYFLAAGRVAFLPGQRQEFRHDVLAVGGNGGGPAGQTLRSRGDRPVRILL